MSSLFELHPRCLLPCVLLFRPTWEGGQYEGDDKIRLDVLRLAMELGADYIDVELQVPSHSPATPPDGRLLLLITYAMFHFGEQLF